MNCVFLYQQFKIMAISEISNQNMCIEHTYFRCRKEIIFTDSSFKSSSHALRGNLFILAPLFDISLNFGIR
jgi:hypothetical protein